MKIVLSALMTLAAVSAFANSPKKETKETTTTTKVEEKKETHVDCKDAKNKDMPECKKAH